MRKRGRERGRERMRESERESEGESVRESVRERERERERVREFILTRMRSSEVPLGVFSGMLMLYRACLKIGRLSFSLIRSMKTRAKPT